MAQNHPEELSVARSTAFNATGTTTATSQAFVAGWQVTNTNAAARYLKLYNKATAATEADTPVITIHLPSTSTVNYSIPGSIRFSAGLSIRCVTGVADNDTTGAGAGEVYTHVFYKVR